KAETGEVELPGMAELAPAQPLTSENSIQNDEIICLECGAKMKQLTKLHLVTHSLTDFDSLKFPHFEGK
ncbi:MAG: MucR family transcriptional regulator, partial [Syntrophobacteraceae bacterium]